MKFVGVRSAMLIVGAGVALAVPTVMVLGAKPAASTAVRHFPVEHGRDYDDFAAQRANQRAAATPFPTPTPSPTPTTPPTAAVNRPATATYPGPPGSSRLPMFSHVFVIVMENKEYGAVIGNPAAPYINSLANSYGLATNYYAASHPSLPNYLALTAGSTFGVTSDCTTCFINATNIADQVEASGRSWKAYMESMPGPCFTGPWSGSYAMKHNPFMYYTDIRNNAARCAAHVVPFTQFWGDMSAGRVPNYVWITPNLCNDMHDCSVATGDAWLRNVVPTITSSAAFRNGGVLFITWDEGSSRAGCCGDTWGGRVATLVISPLSIIGYRSGVAENHYGLLRTVEDAWHLRRLGAAGWPSSAALREYFRN